MPDKGIKDIVRHFKDTIRVIHYDGEKFITPKDLYDMGIVACCECGKILPIEFRYCSECNENVVIFVEDKKK
jgi:hypothetical protein